MTWLHRHETHAGERVTRRTAWHGVIGFGTEYYSLSVNLLHTRSHMSCLGIVVCYSSIIYAAFFHEPRLGPMNHIPSTTPHRACTILARHVARRVRVDFKNSNRSSSSRRRATKRKIYPSPVALSVYSWASYGSWGQVWMGGSGTRPHEAIGSFHSHLLSVAFTLLSIDL